LAPCHGLDTCIKVLWAFFAPSILNPVAYSGVYTSCLNASKEVFLLYTQLAKKRRHNSVIVEIMDLNFIRMFLSEDKSSKKEEKSPPLRESFAGR
jgi:hypothetical protein